MCVSVAWQSEALTLCILLWTTNSFKLCNFGQGKCIFFLQTLKLLSTSHKIALSSHFGLKFPLNLFILDSWLLLDGYNRYHLAWLYLHTRGDDELTIRDDSHSSHTMASSYIYLSTIRSVRAYSILWNSLQF